MDLIAPYHNRENLANSLVKAVDRLRKAQRQPRRPRISVQSTGRTDRQWRVSDRLTDADVRLLVQAFEQGTPKWKLAEQYGISESSVKRLLRAHRTSN
ncbi:hypothetical protein LWP59_34555 [Amycolatopsis acidiphila]|uniref:Helix-turn-helix domain-containing protein n=1 Tax=Amycolatopsis acidiphila TaxID=715473 RepID=A0A558A0J5_9PSEU|nr:hypothetical protein [Amycolatopsis acidiphila]TVT17788.1 hypothetical protein FNH06_30055 [Amycolatopsis acidiphila]UIJ59126.1 hypothetical protein LWP59_34555 [Amycolatopsis acidiphila]GHG98009.1 hypothetical protein GCM10017788_77780 [Amycolatopsis acidiphila]